MRSSPLLLALVGLVTAAPAETEDKHRISCRVVREFVRVFQLPPQATRYCRDVVLRITPVTVLVTTTVTDTTQTTTATTNTETITGGDVGGTIIITADPTTTTETDST